MIESAGYIPSIIQDYLHLSCVQPIYRWYKGKILPSVDHLFMLRPLGEEKCSTGNIRWVKNGKARS